MGGIWRLCLFLAAISCLPLALGCDKGASTGGTTAATVSSEEGERRSSKPSPSEIACHLHSCAPPYYCNREKGVCEQLPCAQSRDCPYGYKCDYARHVCQ